MNGNLFDPFKPLLIRGIYGLSYRLRQANCDKISSDQMHSIRIKKISNFI